MTGTTMVFVWLVIAVVLGIFEAATVALVSIWFAIGAVAAMVPAYFNAPFWVQILVFILVSALCFVFTRPFFKKIIRVNKQPTNADRLVGQEGVATDDIENIECRGKVFISGLTWSARSETGELIPQGAVVTVKKIEGATLVVERKNFEEVK
ncbi:MAG: NfeD family protein [Oscillospiraceae bacterium]|nr:NfeD family protein [Oscillospiraceae bacterium]